MLAATAITAPSLQPSCQYTPGFQSASSLLCPPAVSPAAVAPEVLALFEQLLVGLLASLVAWQQDHTQVSVG